jgi:hypothetical protein
MDHQYVIDQLQANAGTFRSLFSGIYREQITWKPEPAKWCLLEVACHLFDEEREDFRARVKHVLETPDQPMPPINPQDWVLERKYMEQDFENTADKFLEERAFSIKWLNGLKSPSWKQAYMHPKVGPISAEFLLANWLAHDYLHFRQITRLKYQYLQHLAGDLKYAGEW